MNASPASRPVWQRRPPWRFFISLVEAAGAAAFAGTVLGYLGRWHWFPDLFAHFRGQYFAGLAGAVALMLLGRRPWSAALFLAGALANGIALLPLVSPPRSTAAAKAPPSTPGLRIATYNLLYSNPRQAPTLAWLRSAPADVVFLCEVTPDWSAALRSLADVYPHQEHRPQLDPFGCAVLSRRPWTSVEEQRFGSFGSPALAVRFVWSGREVLLLGMHPTPPNGRAGNDFRNAALALAADYMAAQTVPTRLLVGDLNATPWCHPFQALIERTGLTDTARGRGWQPTWNVGSPLFQIPIDHVLASPDLVVTDRRIGPDLGSDHRAVVVGLQATP